MVVGKGGIIMIEFQTKFDCIGWFYKFYLENLLQNIHSDSNSYEPKSLVETNPANTEDSLENFAFCTSTTKKLEHTE